MDRLQEQDIVYSSTLHGNNGMVFSSSLWKNTVIPECVTASSITSLPLPLPSIGERISVGIKVYPTEKLIRYQHAPSTLALSVSTEEIRVGGFSGTWEQLGFAGPGPLYLEFVSVGTSATTSITEVYVNGSLQVTGANINTIQPTIVVAAGGKASDVYFKTGNALRMWEVKTLIPTFDQLGVGLNASGKMRLVADSPVNGKITVRAGINRKPFDPDRTISAGMSGIIDFKQRDNIHEYRKPKQESFPIVLSDQASIEIGMTSTVKEFSKLRNDRVNYGVRPEQGWVPVTSFTPNLEYTLEITSEEVGGVIAEQVGLLKLELLEGFYVLSWYDVTLTVPYEEKVAVVYDHGFVRLVTANAHAIGATYVTCVGSDYLTLSNSVSNFEVCQSVKFTTDLTPIPPQSPTVLHGNSIL